MNETYLTSRQAAKMLGISYRTIQRYIAAGVFPNGFKRGTSQQAKWSIPESDIREYIRQQKEASQKTG